MDFINPNQGGKAEEKIDVWDGTDYGEEETQTSESPPIKKGLSQVLAFLTKGPVSSRNGPHLKDWGEQYIASKLERFEWYSLLTRVNKGILFGQGALILVCVLQSLFVPLVPSLLILVLSVLLTCLGTVSKKYEIDITSILNQEFEEIEKSALQKKAINQLFLIIAFGNFLVITSLLQSFVQPYIDRIFLINTMLGTAGEAMVTQELSQSLWGSEKISHCVYLIPGSAIAFFTYYGRYYEIFLKWSTFYKRWAKGKWFDNPNFTEMFLGKRKDYEPFLYLGVDQTTGAQLWLDPVARMNNFLAQGPVGVGKSQAIFRPFIYQDITYFFRYIREFVKYRKKYKDDAKFEKKFFTKRRAGKMLNGFMVIEPSDDLVRAIYEDLLKTGVPKEMINYVNPADPETPGINAFAGPVDKVVTMVSKIIGDLSKSSNAFFDNTQRTYLKKMIYLLKLSYMVPNDLDKDLVGSAPTFQAFNQLKYNEVLWERKKILGQYIKALEKKQESFNAIQKMTANYRDFMYKYWIAKDVYDYWDKNLTEKEGLILNAKFEHVQGLLTVIDDIASNIYISRVFFQDTDFNFDVLLKYGGILLVNTDVKDLGGDVSIFAKFISLAAEQASFRRIPYCHPMFPYYEDEHPQYVTDNTPVFTAQNRKYQTPGHYACQSKSQYHSKENPQFADSFFTNLRNRGVFQGVLPDDAKWYERLFGQKEIITASYIEGEFNYDNQEASQSKVPERAELVPNITEAELVSLPQFTLAMGITNGKGEVLQFSKVKATPAFKMTDSLPKANLKEMAIWFAEYQKQLTYYNKNVVDLFSLGEDAKIVIQEIQEEEKQSERETAPANIFARTHVKADMDEARAQSHKKTKEEQEAPLRLEKKLKVPSTKKDEALSFASLLLNKTGEDEEF